MHHRTATIASRGLLLLAAACVDDKSTAPSTPEPAPVAPAVATSIRVVISDTTPMAGRATLATATVFDQHGAAMVQTVRWTSSNDSIAEVSPSGLVTPHRRGTVTITAAVDGVRGSAHARVRAFFTSRVTEIPFTLAGLNSGQVTSAIFIVPSALVYTVHGGVEHLFLNPSLFYSEPAIPIHHFVKDASHHWRLEGTYPEVAMGTLRDHAMVQQSGQMVFADHGLELNSGYQSWPFGDVWLADLAGTQVRWRKLSTVKGFHHSITVADFNSDGRKDIAVMHMGTRPWLPQCGNILIFTQTVTGEFVYDPAVIACLPPAASNQWIGAGAIVAADVNGDGIPEIIQADYRGGPQNAPYAFAVFGRDSIVNGNARYSVRRIIPRAGTFANVDLGATKLFVKDFNNDGHVDLVVTLEGDGGAANNTIDFWYGDGTGNFRASGLNLRPEPGTISMRELEVADINRDGKPDLLFNAYRAGPSNSWWDASTQSIDLSKLVWLNTGTGFRRLPPLPLPMRTTHAPYVKWFVQQGAIKGFFVAMGADGMLRIGELELLEDLRELLPP
jgi:hypothetical protein